MTKIEDLRVKTDDQLSRTDLGEAPQARAAEPALPVGVGPAGEDRRGSARVRREHRAVSRPCRASVPSPLQNRPSKRDARTMPKRIPTGTVWSSATRTTRRSWCWWSARLTPPGVHGKTVRVVRRSTTPTMRKTHAAKAGEVVRIQECAPASVEAEDAGLWLSSVGAAPEAAAELERRVDTMIQHADPISTWPTIQRRHAASSASRCSAAPSAATAGVGDIIVVSSEGRPVRAARVKKGDCPRRPSSCAPRKDIRRADGSALSASTRNAAVLIGNAPGRA
jgi:hypothetical protein